MPFNVRQWALDRCAREQRQIVEEATACGIPTGAQCLGYFDWEIEKRFIAHVERAFADSTGISGEAKQC